MSGMNWDRVAADTRGARHGNAYVKSRPFSTPKKKKQKNTPPARAKKERHKPKIKPRVSYPVIVQRHDLFADLAGAGMPSVQLRHDSTDQ